MSEPKKRGRHQPVWILSTIYGAGLVEKGLLIVIPKSQNRTLKRGLPAVVNSKSFPSPKVMQCVKVELVYVGQILRLYDTLKDLAKLV